MKSILEALHDGDIFPQERIVSKDPEYRPLNRKISDERAYLKGRLNQQDIHRFDELESMYMSTTSMHASESFMHGFKLGALIMVEVFTGKADLMHGKG